ncbi:MAG: class I SAM-dependent methyltransferase, partial [Fibrobacter sp.]|nr:class I SAM-dependent methyltransferase [Fibrobacter sp.]
MITNGSYELETFSTSMKSEIKRLDAQIDLFWSEEISVYKNAGIKDNSHIIDLGCGTGYLIEKLSREFPNAKFTGVEQDQKLFDISCQRLQNVPSVLEINHASIEQFSQTDHDYDIAIMRLVLEHIPNPLNTLNQIRSILKPGGRIIIIDNDFDYHLKTYPPIPELDQLYAAYKRSRIDDGGDPCIGIRLPSLLSQAGFDR